MYSELVSMFSLRPHVSYVECILFHENGQVRFIGAVSSVLRVQDNVDRPKRPKITDTHQ